MKRGLGAKPILKSDIEIAQMNTRSAKQAAIYLNIAYNTYKKWAKAYGIWKTNQNLTGVSRVRRGRSKRQEDRLKEALDGKPINYARYKIVGLLIKYGYLREECYRCGYNEQRVTDRRVPLLVYFKDGNNKNFRIENLEMICYCCYHNQIGNLIGHLSKYSYYKET